MALHSHVVLAQGQVLVLLDCELELPRTRTEIVGQIKPHTNVVLEQEQVLVVRYIPTALVTILILQVSTDQLLVRVLQPVRSSPASSYTTKAHRRCCSLETTASLESGSTPPMVVQATRIPSTVTGYTT